ncbi:hypothetical protein [Enterococcus ureasiticus]|uniref:Uncharacterized protein n=1 Tax=Enterococcus ureasiticus TaxID=903984 RepID=A0A1E5GAF2_9ENTE|nr:hypothetical protein [Enterococcus ureasiticus]OEG09637.1 hypothetical protein BCR21_14945 [Enterococcus ureasiticus]
MKKISVGLVMLSLSLLVSVAPQNASAQEKKDLGISTNLVGNVTTKKVTITLEDGAKWTFNDIYNAMSESHGLTIAGISSVEEVKKMHSLLNAQASEFTLENIDVTDRQNKKQRINLAVKINSNSAQLEHSLEFKTKTKWTRDDLFNNIKSTLGFSILDMPAAEFEKLNTAETYQVKNFTLKNIKVKTNDQKVKTVDIKISIIEEDYAVSVTIPKGATWHYNDIYGKISEVYGFRVHAIKDRQDVERMQGFIRNQTKDFRMTNITILDKDNKTVDVSFAVKITEQ